MEPPFVGNKKAKLSLLDKPRFQRIYGRQRKVNYGEKHMFTYMYYWLTITVLAMWVKVLWPCEDIRFWLFLWLIGIKEIEYFLRLR